MPASAGSFEVMPQEFIRPNPQQGREYSRLRALVEMPDHGDEAIRVARDLLKTILDHPRPSAHLTDQLADAVTIDAMTMFLIERGVALADGDEEPFLRTKRVKPLGSGKTKRASNGLV